MQSILCDLKDCPLCMNGKWCLQSTLVLKNGMCSTLYSVQNGQVIPKQNPNFDKEKVTLTIYNANNAKDKENGKESI